MPGQTVFDLYAGVGLFSRFAAERGANVLAVEQSISACDDFAFNLDDLESVSLYQAGVEQALPSLPPPPDAVIVDPPRAGLGREIVSALIAHAPPRLLPLSPATLRRWRDGRLLADAGFALQNVAGRPVPADVHIESVSTWTR
jgi:tRNA/tmRNA/rRNA uracil-C5-methylase (TrmA/RlmC/RlmD family)